MKTLKEYIELLEGEVTPGLRAVGVSEPEDKTQLNPEVDVSYNQDIDGNPNKAVSVNAGGQFDGDPDELRTALRQAGVAFPDQDPQPNQSGISVSVDSNGRIFAMADGEKADELLSILKNAGLYKGTGNA